MPRECNLVVNSGDGGLTVERVNGNIQLTTADGFVKGDQLEGDVTVDTGMAPSSSSVLLERFGFALATGRSHSPGASPTSTSSRTTAP